MKKLRRLVSLTLALSFLFLMAPPAVAGQPFTLKASGAQTGASTGSLVAIGNWRQLAVTVNVTAGSGTVNPFRVWIEGTWDGTNWQELACELVLKSGATAPGTPATQRDIVNETAVVASGKYTALCRVLVDQVRAAWNIAGASPSETFSVSAWGF